MIHGCILYIIMCTSSIFDLSLTRHDYYLFKTPRAGCLLRMLCEDFTSVPVTALCAQKEGVILAGISSYLVQIPLNDQAYSKRKIFKHQAIHCIDTIDECIAVAGGRSLSFVRDSEEEREERLDDWIIKIKWITHDKLAVLFSYNSVAVFDSACNKICEEKCITRCIVYGGCLAGDSVQDITCCSGTVFNKILYWKPFSESKGEVLRVLSGHRGIIFDVAFDESMLVSVSDDRTVRVWDLGESGESRVIYTHTARVWKVVLSGQRIVVVGEGCMCLVFSRDGLLGKESQPHSGKSIWSVDVCGDKVVTGGGDCGIVLDVLPTQERHNDKILLNASELEKGDSPKWVCWCSETELIIGSSLGKLYIHDTLTKETKLCSNMQGDVIDLMRLSGSGYSVFAHDKEFLVIGGINGDVIVIRKSSKCLKKKSNSCKSKVLSIVIFDSSAVLSYLVSYENGELHYYYMGEAYFGVGEFSVDHHSKLDLPSSKHPWAECALQFLNYLMVGDRSGGIHLFCPNFSNHGDTSKGQQPLYSIKGIHGHHGTSQILLSGDRLSSIGRDGNIIFYRVENNKLIMTGKNKLLPHTTWLEKQVVINDQAYVECFHGKTFRLSTFGDTLETVFEAECGGANRSWDCYYSSEQINLAYVIKSSVCTVSSPFTPSKSQHLIRPAHGLDVNSAALLPNNAIITASEDQCLLIRDMNAFALRKIPGHISGIKSISFLKDKLFSVGGKASLRCWKVFGYEVPNLLYNDGVVAPDTLSDKVPDSFYNKNEEPDQVGKLPDLELLSDYNVVSDVHIPVGYNTDYILEKSKLEHADLRVMSVDCMCCNGSELVIVGLSDGREVLYEFRGAAFHKLQQAEHSNCVTRVRIVEYCNELYTLAADTFGHVHVSTFDRSSITKLDSWTIRPHTCGINGIDINCPDFVTIGDDGAITLSTLREAALCSKTVHFSAGIAVKIIQSKSIGFEDCSYFRGQSKPSRIISVGSDQRINLLSFDLELLYCCYTDVTDPHDMVVQGDRVIVCGKGTQGFRLCIK